ncbi:MAG: polyamine aminopropyltransferase, partial [Hyphomicrobiales bacterium]|nr:polyamine aminopropyltransferase [Hyphomicrobiales bacterium]
MAKARWITEKLFDELGVRTSYRAKKVLRETRTGHQHLVLFEHAFFGTMLMLDDATQIAIRDAFIYQEMMAHVPLFAHGRVHDVLIV